MLETVGAVGYEATTMGMVLGRAGISTRAFELEFEGKDDCFLAAFDSAIAEIEFQLADAVDEAATWLDGFRAGVGRLLDLLDERPEMARALVVEAPRAGPWGQQRWDRLLSRAAQLIDRARLEADGLEPPPHVAAEAIVAGLYNILWSRLVDFANGSVRESSRRKWCNSSSVSSRGL